MQPSMPRTVHVCRRVHVCVCVCVSQDLDQVTASRDEETRQAGEQQLSAVVRASLKKDKMGVERLMVIESAVRDVATASALALNELQTRLDKGVSEVSGMHGLLSMHDSLVCAWVADKTR